MRALAGQRRVREATKRKYKVVGQVTEATYMAIDWQSAKTRFQNEFPLEKEFEIYVYVERGLYGHYRFLKHFIIKDIVPSFDEVMGNLDRAMNFAFV